MIIFGATPKTIAENLGISLEEAETIYNTFLSVFPGIKHFMEYQKTKAWEDHAVQTIAGHRRNLPITDFDRWNKRAYNISLNHPIQGTASYIVNLAMLELWRRLKEIGGVILLTVHDSILSQVPKGKIEEGLKLYKEVLIKYVGERMGYFLTIPLKIDLKRGMNWHSLKKVG